MFVLICILILKKIYSLRISAFLTLNLILNPHKSQQNHEIRFNLMAVVPDRMCAIKEQIELVSSNQQKISKAIGEALVSLENVENAFEISENIETVSSNCPIELSINKNSTESTILSNSQRQLRSRATSQTNLLSNQAKKHRRSDECIEMIFDLRTSDQVEEILLNNKYFEDVASEASIKLKSNLCKLVDRFEVLELCKTFRVESLNSTSLLSQKDTKNEFVNNTKSIYVMKVVELDELKSLEVYLKNEMVSGEAKLNEEIDKRKKYRVLKANYEIFLPILNFDHFCI
jgi:hypothetical protein